MSVRVRVSPSAQCCMKRKVRQLYGWWMRQIVEKHFSHSTLCNCSCHSCLIYDEPGASLSGHRVCKNCYGDSHYVENSGFYDELCKTCNGNCCRVKIWWVWKVWSDQILLDIRNTPYQEIIKHAKKEYYFDDNHPCEHLVDNKCDIYSKRDTFCKTYFCNGALYKPV